MNARIKPLPVERSKLANALRFLAIDAVEAAKSGHPGMPMGMADIAEVLWRRFLKHNPADPHWPDRDRFMLSNGHGSMLLYSLLHLTGYALPLEELKRFRQLHSKTPGHPEVDVTPGVETTTGPLGQGLANAVGMALSEQLLAAHFNRPEHPIVDHRTWVFLGDGCLMEGVSHEACSLAGTWGLSKLIAVYDDNGISIDGHVEHWFTDDTPKRFEAYGWRVIRNVDGHDTAAIEAALKKACKPGGQPTLICCKTVIGKGSPNKAGTHDVHGAALGAAEVAATRAALGWTAGPFEIAEEIRDAWDARAVGAKRQADWQRRFAAYAEAYPDLAAEFERRVSSRQLPTGWPTATAEALAKVVGSRASVASRKASQNAIEALQPLLPELLGGSADLGGSNLTEVKASVPVRRGRWGNYINYGVREFGMSAIMNGIALHGGLHPLRWNFPHVFRLQPQRRAHVCADAQARPLRIYPRQYRARRRRSDASAHRACRQPAIDPAQRRVAALRCRGDPDCMDCGDRAERRPDLPDPVATKPAVLRASRAADRRYPQRRVCIGRL